MKNAMILCTMIPFINMVAGQIKPMEMIAIAVWGIVFFTVCMVEIIKAGK